MTDAFLRGRCGQLNWLLCV